MNDTTFGATSSGASTPDPSTASANATPTVTTPLAASPERSSCHVLPVAEGTIVEPTLMTTAEAVFAYWTAYHHLRFVEVVGVDMRPVLQHLNTSHGVHQVRKGGGGDTDYDFRHSTFTQCTFRGATLISPLFIGARLDRCDFRDACLRSPQFTFGDLRYCDFTTARVEQAHIEHAVLVSNDWIGAQFQDGQFLWSSLGTENFQQADLRSTRWRQCVVAFSTFDQVRGLATFEACHLNETSFRASEAVLAMDLLTFEQVDFTGARLPDSSHDIISYLLTRAADTVEHLFWAGLVKNRRDWCWPRFAVAIKRTGNEQLMVWIVTSLSPWEAFHDPLNAMLLKYWPSLVQRGVWCGPKSSGADDRAQRAGVDYCADPSDEDLDGIAYDPIGFDGGFGDDDDSEDDSADEADEDDEDWDEDWDEDGDEDGNPPDHTV